MLLTTLTKLLTIKSTVMKKIIRISRERAIQIAMNHNCVSKEIAERYTDSELKEVLRHLRLKAGFYVLPHAEDDLWFVAIMGNKTK